MYPILVDALIESILNLIFTAQTKTFYNSKVLGIGPVGFSTGELKIHFTNPSQLGKVIFFKGALFRCTFKYRLFNFIPDRYFNIDSKFINEMLFQIVQYF